MILYPAMDLMGGRVVRLRQGRFDEATRYDADPGAALAAFAAAGAEWAHVVDLDGAKARAPVQHELIASLARDSGLKLQVGGGFRTDQQVAAMLEAGVARVVIGSLAVTAPERVRALIDTFGGERITLAFDVRISGDAPMVATSGWAEASATTLWDAAAHFPEARHILLTDIGRAGMLAGPNFALLEEAAQRLPDARIQASGGVASLDDLRRLRSDGAIVGKALWDGRFGLAEALDAVA